MAWYIVVTDLAGAELGEVFDAEDRKVTPEPLNRLPSASFTADTRNAMVPELMRLDERLVKWYDDELDPENPIFVGPVITFEKVVTEQRKSVAFVCAGGGWYLGKRLVGKSATGFKRGTALAPVDRGRTFADALAEANAERATRIVAGTIRASASSAYGPVNYKRVLDIGTELSAPIDGYDWKIVPLDPATSGGAIGRLEVYTAIGQLRPNAAFVYGEPPNTVKEWRHVGSAEGSANRVHVIPPGWPENTALAPVSASDQPSIDLRGLQEDSLAPDFEDANLRQRLADEHVRIRKQPRHVIRFTPQVERAELRYGRDYREGDVVPFKAKEPIEIRDDTTGQVLGHRPVATVDALFRIYSVTLDRDPQGNVVPDVALEEEA